MPLYPFRLTVVFRFPLWMPRPLAERFDAFREYFDRSALGAFARLWDRDPACEPVEVERLLSALTTIITAERVRVSHTIQDELEHIEKYFNTLTAHDVEDLDCVRQWHIESMQFIEDMSPEARSDKRTLLHELLTEFRAMVRADGGAS